MTPEEAIEVVRTQHRAVMATTRGDGRPQLSPVMVGVDDDGSLLVSTRETAMKARNLERRPWATLCVLADGFWGPWVQVEGPVTLEHLPAAMDGLVRYYRAVSGEHPDWDEYRQAMAREKRVLVRLRVERAGPSREG
jgi:PPOX class probable F420-dependent enzyme